MEDWRLGKEIVSKDNLSATGKVFAVAVCEAYNNGYKKGFGSTSIAVYETDYDIMKNKEKHEALKWLVKNGYLYCREHEFANIWRDKYTCCYDICNRYGVTKKGWGIAHMYVKEMEKPAWMN